MRENVVRAFYFSVAPSLFGDIAERLHEHGIADAWSRIVVEKPFGRDLASRPGAERGAGRSISPKRRSTGSTIIWARKPSRT